MAKTSINSGEHSVFWYVDPVKLAIMSACTFGLYDIFWMAKNWTYIKERESKDILPFWRAWFSPIWVYSLFQEIKAIGESKGTKAPLHVGWLATAFILLSVCGRLPNAWSLLGLLSFLPLWAVQKYINSLNIDSPTPINNKLTAWNWVAIVIGGSLLLLSIIGSFFPDGPA